MNQFGTMEEMMGQPPDATEEMAVDDEQNILGHIHAHHKAMLLFKQYMLVGGMPKCVDRYLEENRSFIAADAEKRDILALYANDISRADVRYRTRIASIFDQIPAFLSQHEKRVRLANVEAKATFPMYQDTFFWL